MPTAFDTAFARVKELVADFRANEKIYLSPDYGEGLRRLISTNSALERVVDFGANQVFSATTYTELVPEIRTSG